MLSVLIGLPLLVLVQEVWRLRDDERDLDEMRTTSKAVLGDVGREEEVDNAVIGADAVPEASGPLEGMTMATTKVTQVMTVDDGVQEEQPRVVCGGDSENVARAGATFAAGAGQEEGDALRRGAEDDQHRRRHEGNMPSQSTVQECEGR
jgi:hypothetical protein